MVNKSVSKSIIHFVMKNLNSKKTETLKQQILKHTHMSDLERKVTLRWDGRQGNRGHKW
jgi:hypothetical protein